VDQATAFPDAFSVHNWGDTSTFHIPMVTCTVAATVFAKRIKAHGTSSVLLELTRSMTIPHNYRNHK
jgi:hypothetical protein